VTLTQAERAALERSRASATGIAPAATAVLIDHDLDGAVRLLAATEQTYRAHLARSLRPDPEPGEFGFAPSDFAVLASLHVLCRPRHSRELSSLRIAFEPPFTTAAYAGTTPVEREAALALLAFLEGSDTVAARHLLRVRDQELPLLDAVVVQVISLLVRGRGVEIPDLLDHLAPRYAEAMALGLWRVDPDAFLHVRLLATLKGGHELERLDLDTLPDTVPYVPLSLATRHLRC
jgi:hypothetical protein